MPIANAYELRQGLEDRGVTVEMVVYKGHGHTIMKPRSVRAVARHNLAWFNHFIWNDPLPDFANPDVPKKEKSTDDLDESVGGWTINCRGAIPHFPRPRHTLLQPPASRRRRAYRDC